MKRRQEIVYFAQIKLTVMKKDGLFYAILGLLTFVDAWLLVSWFILTSNLHWVVMPSQERVSKLGQCCFPLF